MKLKMNQFGKVEQEELDEVIKLMNRLTLWLEYLNGRADSPLARVRLKRVQTAIEALERLLASQNS